MDSATNKVIIDEALPFLLDQTQVRGRVVRLKNVARDILGAHNYPSAINRLLEQMMCLCSILSVDMKQEGRFALQLSAQESAIKMLVCEINHKGGLRAYAHYEESFFEGKEKDDFAFGDLIRKGLLLLHTDYAKQKAGGYQAVIALQPEGLFESFETYFKQSEQIPSMIKGFVREEGTENGFEAAAFMLQRLPTPEKGNREKDDKDWEQALAYAETIKGSETLDASLSSLDLLYRLFHEIGVRVLPTKTLSKTCSCSMEKITNTIKQFGAKERQEMVKNKKIEASCQFCNKNYIIEGEDLIRLLS